MIIVFASLVVSLLFGVYLVATGKLAISDTVDAFAHAAMFILAGLVAGLFLAYIATFFIDFELMETDSSTLLPIREGSNMYVEIYYDENGDDYYLIRMAKEDGSSEYELVLETGIVEVVEGLDSGPKITTYDYSPTNDNYWIFTVFLELETDQVVISVPLGSVDATRIPLSSLSLR